MDGQDDVATELVEQLADDRIARDHDNAVHEKDPRDDSQRK